MSGASASSASLDWSLKRSFVEYVARMPDGRMSVTDGADVEGENFRFALVSRELTENGGLATFRGDIRFAGHGNLLFVCVADPAVAWDGGDAIVSVQLPDTVRGPADRIELARGIVAAVEENDGLDRYSIRTLSLSEDGSALFAGVYPPGAPLDDITFTITR